VLPYRTTDGSWGCMIQLDVQGTIRLDSLTNEARGSAIVVFVATKQGVHQVIDMTIDRNITDGVITIPRGLTEGEIAVFRQQFKVIDVAKDQLAEARKKAAPKTGAAREWAEEPPTGGIMPTPVGNPGGTASTSTSTTPRYTPTPTASASSKKSGRKGAEPDLPRLAD
jgi:hypothetical protein